MPLDMLILRVGILVARVSCVAMLSKQSIDKYREIYRKQYGVDIPEEEAAEQANRLLTLARIVFQPMPTHFEERYNQLLSGQKRPEEKLSKNTRSHNE
jgi:hypothetical protein